MRFSIRWLLFLVWLFSAATQAEALRLLQAYPINNPENQTGLQPSGLAVCQGELWMVSDRHNQQVFQLQLNRDSHTATAIPRLHLDKIPKPSLQSYDFGTQWWSQLSRRYDWEGISCDTQGNLYLLSETLSQVLRIAQNGQPHWLGELAYLAGRDKGLFEQFNAKAEGLAVNAEKLFMAAERQPRGIIVQSRLQPEQVKAHYLNGFPDLTHPEDFSGLWQEGEQLYTLERNHFQVCRRQIETMATEQCWSYEQAEHHPDYAYHDQRYGMAEGIARLGQYLYLLLDNNESPRLNASRDTRAQLLVFKLPQDW